MGLLYGRAGRLNAKNTGFRPAQKLWKALDELRAVPVSTLGAVGSPRPLTSHRAGRVTLPADAAGRQPVLQALLDQWNGKRWSLRRELGSGASGHVWEVADSRLVAVAMKFVVVSPEDAHKAEREAAVLQRVAHEHVSRLHEYRYFPEAGVSVLALEFLEGGSLEALLEARGGKLEQREVAAVGFDVLQALVHVHAQVAANLLLKNATG